MKPIEANGRRKYEPELRDGDVPEEAEALLNTESLMEKVWLDSMPKSAVKAIERGDARKLSASVSGNSAFGKVASTNKTHVTAEYARQSGSIGDAESAIDNREELLMSLYTIHDDLVNFFEKSSNSDKGILNDLTKTINLVGSCIENIGGEIQTFSALDHVSGLDAPVLDNMAEKVISTTKSLYKGANIDSIFEENGAIVAVFSGEQDGILFRTAGKIKPLHGWSGNEALDYIYSKGSGKMSVKVYEAQKWIDKSNNFEITWSVPHEVDTKVASKEDIDQFEKVGSGLYNAKTSQGKAQETAQKTAKKTSLAPNVDTNLAPDINTNFEIKEKSDS